MPKALGTPVAVVIALLSLAGCASQAEVLSDPSLTVEDKIMLALSRADERVPDGAHRLSVDGSYLVAFTPDTTPESPSAATDVAVREREDVAETDDLVGEACSCACACPSPDAAASCDADGTAACGEVCCGLCIDESDCSPALAAR
jgi:hypothetical protein